MVRKDSVVVGTEVLKNEVIMNGFKVENVEPCPKCNSAEYARREGFLQTVVMCCANCDYEASGAIRFGRVINLHDDRDDFIEASRVLFNHWNEKVAIFKDTKINKVEISNIE